MTVYNWFTGKNDPLPAQKSRIQEYLGVNSVDADEDILGTRIAPNGDVVYSGDQERTGKTLLPFGEE